MAVRVVAPSEAPDWRMLLHRSEGGALYKTMDNVVTILTHDPAWTGVLAYDEFAVAMVTLTPPPWPVHVAFGGESKAGRWLEMDAVRTLLWLAEVYGFRPNERMVEAAACIVAQRNVVNPVRSYFDSLVWDGVARVAGWLASYLGADAEDFDIAYLPLVGQCWLISAVARTYQPGCMAKYVLVIEGRQDIGKSTACRVLGGHWFKDTGLNIESKDAYIALQEVLIYELAELDSLKRVDRAKLKQYISSPMDNFRGVFEKRNMPHPRRNVFVGTVNPGEGRSYLTDDTGDVRFWPVRCEFGPAQLDMLRRDRDQIWAEAVHLYRAGKLWYPANAHERELCKVVQDSRYDTHVWADPIREYLDTAPNDVKMIEIMDHLRLGPRDQHRGNQIVIGGIVGKVGGWERSRKQKGHQRGYEYHRIVSLANPKGMIEP